MRLHYISFPFLLCLTLLTVNTRAQSWIWATQNGGFSDDRAMAVVTDGSGNVYSAGQFSQTAYIAGDTLTVTNYTDAYIAKYNSSGVPIWTVQMDAEFTGGLSVDGTGVYITGSFSSPTIAFGSETFTNTGIGDVFVAKYSHDGVLLWATAGGSTDPDNGYGIATDVFGNTYVTGNFGETMIWDNHTLVTTGLYDVFLAKLDTGGNVLWLKKAGGISSEKGRGLDTDADGNVFMCGDMNAAATFTGNTGSVTLTPVGFADIFLAKYTAAGDLAWAKNVGSASSDRGEGLTVDSDGNAYVIGTSAGLIDFGTFSLTNAGWTDAMIIKYNTNGSVVWAKAYGGPENDDVFSADTDASGNIYWAFRFEGTATIGDTTLTSTGGDGVLIKQDSSGNVLWILQFGGPGDDNPYSVAIDDLGSGYICGEFKNQAAFGNVSLTSLGNYDGWLAKFSTGATSVSDDGGLYDLKVYPNPFSNTFVVEQQIPLKDCWLETRNAVGQVVSTVQLSGSKTQVDMAALVGGVYLVSVRTGSTTVLRRILIKQ